MKSVKRIGVCLAAIAMMAIAVPTAADAARDVGHKAKVSIVKNGGTLRVDVRARGGIALSVIGVYCKGYQPAFWAHRGTGHDRLVRQLPNARCDVVAKARAQRGKVRVVAK